MARPDTHKEFHDVPSSDLEKTRGGVGEGSDWEESSNWYNDATDPKEYTPNDFNYESDAGVYP
jgi:hypothetical protein